MYDNLPSSCSQPLPLPIKKGFIGKSQKNKIYIHFGKVNTNFDLAKYYFMSLTWPCFKQWNVLNFNLDCCIMQETEIS